jgi:hypothetical protein
MKNVLSFLSFIYRTKNIDYEVIQITEEIYYHFTMMKKDER